MDVGNPFHFNHIDNMKSGDAIMNVPSPCVVMASPGNTKTITARPLLFSGKANVRCDHSDETAH
jgi:hypothetical protein